jgi:hypothetical protein
MSPRQAWPNEARKPVPPRERKGGGELMLGGIRCRAKGGAP